MVKCTGVELAGRGDPPVGRGQRAEDPLRGERPHGRVDRDLQPVRREGRLGLARRKDQHVLHGDRTERAGTSRSFRRPVSQKICSECRVMIIGSDCCDMSTKLKPQNTQNTVQILMYQENG